ncbi:MAG: Bacterial membrane flanked domain protein [Methanoregula sp. PtaU1.Bin051]|nr:MAG: Bacterial membrane flanked domain protein [Methanoregula sp. PtaU1.Bin051]
MVTPEHFPRNAPFKPAPAFVAWFIAGFLLFIALIIGFIVVPLILAGAIDIFLTMTICGVLVVITVLFILWTRLYYDSMFYELHDDELRWRRGVWFRTTGIVPYNRITNIDIKQGPLMRYLNISTISIQTAGYSGQAVPEIRIEAIERAEELRELLRKAVRACSAGAGDGTGSGPAPKAVPAGPVATTGTGLLILDELKKIRMLLEQQQKR